MSLAAEVIKRFEGLRLKAYQDQGGVWTIGYGQTGKGIGPGTVWTLKQAEDALGHYLAALEDVVRNLLRVPANENQLAALLSLAYNIGTAAFGKSTLLRKFNAGDTAGAADQFLVWNKVKGQVNRGLANRRAAERALFLKS